MSQSTRNELHGSRVIYHFLQKELLEEDIWLFQMLASRLVIALGIWLHPDVYRCLPVLVPHARRDPDSKGNVGRGIPYRWGSADDAGFVRDDNSLVKGLPQSLQIKAPRNKHYDGRKIKTGFTASHVWRFQTSGRPAATDPVTYSFVPNLIWLPTEVSKLTDREGSFVQKYVQALAHKIYAQVELQRDLREIARQAWDRVEVPKHVPESGLPDPDSLNYFLPSKKWAQARINTIAAVAGAASSVREGRLPPDRVIASRYSATLINVDHRALRELQSKMTQYAEAANTSLAKVLIT